MSQTPSFPTYASTSAAAGGHFALPEGAVAVLAADAGLVPEAVLPGAGLVHPQNGLELAGVEHPAATVELLKGQER